jgi:hypothetical protein
MIKVIELRKVINAALKTVHPRVYFQAAPDDAIFPYLVYDLPNSVDDGYLEQFVLDMDGWDTSTDTTVLETLMDNVNNSLDGMTSTADGLIMSFYLDNRLSLLDDDPRIKRRKYTYQVRTYQRR